MTISTIKIPKLLKLPKALKQTKCDSKLTYDKSELRDLLSPK